MLYAQQRGWVNGGTSGRSGLPSSTAVQNRGTGAPRLVVKSHHKENSGDAAMSSVDGIKEDTTGQHGPRGEGRGPSTGQMRQVPVMGPADDSGDGVQGQLALAAVAMLWGSYSPALRWLYTLEQPPTPVALTAARTVIQAAVLYASAMASSAAPSRPSASQGSRLSQDGLEKGREKGGKVRPPAGQGPLRMMRSWMAVPASSAWVAGMEMGLWNFLATSAQAIGLEYTSATRGAFLIQSTALLTPLLATLAGDTLARSVWLGCAVALGGTLLITLDHPAAAPALQQPSGFLSGDALIFASAFFYSLATVRLGVHARSVPSVRLAAYKSVALAAISLVWLLWTAGELLGEGLPLLTLWKGYKNPGAWALLLYSALGPGALAALLQTLGQSKVPPAQAQVLYSTTPLWAALFAGLFISGEDMGYVGWAGGLTILVAGYIARRPS